MKAPRKDRKELDRRAAWKRSHPWVRFVEYARRRCACLDPEKWWPNYGAKGIKCSLTGKDLAAIWERDGAANSKRAWARGNNFMAGRMPEPTPEYV